MTNPGPEAYEPCVGDLRRAVTVSSEHPGAFGKLFEVLRFTASGKIVGKFFEPVSSGPQATARITVVQESEPAEISTPAARRETEKLTGSATGPLPKIGDGVVVRVNDEWVYDTVTRRDFSDPKIPLGVANAGWVEEFAVCNPCCVSERHGEAGETIESAIRRAFDTPGAQITFTARFLRAPGISWLRAGCKSMPDQELTASTIVSLKRMTAEEMTSVQAAEGWWVTFTGTVGEDLTVDLGPFSVNAENLLEKDYYRRDFSYTLPEPEVQDTIVQVPYGVYSVEESTDPNARGRVVISSPTGVLLINPESGHGHYVAMATYHPCVECLKNNLKLCRGASPDAIGLPTGAYAVTVPAGLTLDIVPRGVVEVF